MMATRGKRVLALLVTCMMVLGMLPAAALAADSEAEHIHGQAGLAGETYYTGVCDYTEGETVQSETPDPDLCDEAVNAHEHTDACTAAEDGEAAVCTGELNAHEHTDACYSVTQTEGTWTCETGEPPVVEEPEAEPTQKPAEEPAETTPVEEQITLMSGEPMTYTISGAKAFKVTEWRGDIPEFSFEGVPGSTIDPKDLPAGPVLYQYNGNDWYYIYTGKIMGSGWNIGYTVDHLTLGQNGKITAALKFGLIWDETSDMSDLRFFYEYAFAFPDLGSEGVTVMYSIDGGPLVAIDPSEPLIFSQAEVKKIGTVAFFVKAQKGFYPADQFSGTTGDQEGILNRIDDPKPEHELPASFDKLKQEALAEGFTHEFHYSEFKDGEFSDQGTRGYKLKGQPDTNEYTITYHANAPEGTQATGEVTAQSGTWNTRFDIAENGFTVPGYEFQGWNTATDGSGENYAPGYTYTIMGKDLDLYAMWQKGSEPVKSYTVTVNYLVENVKEPLQSAYISDSIEAGTAYDVSEQIPETIRKDDVTYTRHTATGDGITGTIGDRNVVVNVYYQAERAYTVEYFLETGHSTDKFEMSTDHSGKGGTLAWNDKPVTSAPYVIAIDGYTYDEANTANVKEVAYGSTDQALILKLYYKKDAPVDPGRYTVIYTDGTGLEGAEHQVTVTKTVGETYAVLADNSTTGFAKTGHNFDSWKLREGSVVHGEGDRLYGDKGATIYYDAQWTLGTYSVTVTKTASGHSLPDNFAIAVTDKDGLTVETLALAQATLDNGVYTWTTSALTFGETYTVTEQNYAVGGYDLTASAQVLTGTDVNGNVYQTTNGVTASLTLNDLAQTSGTAVAFTNSYSLTNSGGGGSSYSYYRVTVNYLDRDGNVLDGAYQTDRIREGRTYDVTEQANKDIDGYQIDEIEGATTGTVRGNVTVNVWYVPDVDNGGTVDIPDADVPQGDAPDTTPGTVPDGNGQDGDTGSDDGIVIEDGDVPLGGQPDGMGNTGDQTDGKSGGSDGTIIIDEETPKGNLPQTGTLAQQTDPTHTAGMLALALSLAAAGLTVTISRKKEDEA